MDDSISRQWLMECVEKGWIKFDTQEDENRFVHLIRDIAPPAQQEQTDCEYCHEDSDGCVRSIEKNSHAWLVRRGRTMKLRVGFNGRHSECDILFCPMCGRRLTDG